MAKKVSGFIRIEFIELDVPDVIWSRDSYTTYEVVKNLFVVKNGDQWIGIYPFDNIRSVKIL